MIEPANADSWYMMAQNHSRVGEHAQAVAAFSSALECESHHIKARVGRGSALQQTGEHEAAIRDFNNVIQQVPEWTGLYVVYYCRAVSQQVLGRFAAAVNDCNKAIQSNPSHIDSLYVRGTALKDLGQVENAIEDMNSLLKADPTYHKAYYVRATLFHLQERWQKSISDFSAFLTLVTAPNRVMADCHRLRGVAAYELGQNEAAIEDLSLAIEFDPSDDTTYFRRSQVYKAMGNTEQSEADFNEGKSLFDANQALVDSIKAEH